jgi:hypothetical protein
MSDNDQEPADDTAAQTNAENEAPLNRAQRRALAAGKSSPGNAALSRSSANGGINHATVPPAQRIQTRGAGRGK